MVVALETMSSARDDGLGATTAEAPSQLILATLLSTIGFVVLLWSTGLSAVVVFLAMGAAGVCAGFLARRHIGGQTGDVLGAIQQLTEIAGLVALSVVAI